jgi:hypothetical protein
MHYTELDALRRLWKMAEGLPYDEYTNAALEDVILYQISSKKSRNIDKDRPKNPCWIVEGYDTLEWVNLKYAFTYLHRYFLLIPRRPFIIKKSDFTPPLIERLERLEFSELNKVMIGVVRRILESVDSYYYHTSGIHGKISWMFVN